MFTSGLTKSDKQQVTSNFLFSVADLLFLLYSFPDFVEGFEVTSLREEVIDVTTEESASTTESTEESAPTTKSTEESAPTTESTEKSAPITESTEESAPTTQSELGTSIGNYVI